LIFVIDADKIIPRIQGADVNGCNGHSIAPRIDRIRRFDDFTVGAINGYGFNG
jgi:hypothetical protein